MESFSKLFGSLLALVYHSQREDFLRDKFSNRTG